MGIININALKNNDVSVAQRRMEAHIQSLVEAWEFGYSQGFYVSAEGPKAKDDLNALVSHRQARRVDGFWRHTNEPDHIRLQYLRWADNWVPT